MKPLPVFLFIFAFLVLSVTVSAQCTVPGDQEPCDGNVSMTELTDYINLWYTCSSCYPDMFEAIQAYYGIPVCGDGSCNGDETCLSCPGDCGSCGPIQMTDNITQFDSITWTFDKEYPYGQFANGDYWVIGPVNVTSISPGWDGSYDGTMINPNTLSQQGYQAVGIIGPWNIGRLYNPALTELFPQIVDVNSSIVSTIGCRAACGNPAKSLVETAAVLTVLGEVPPADAFRPPYFGTEKPIFRADDLNLDLLPDLAPVADTPTFPSVERTVERVWLDHWAYFSDTPNLDGWLGECVHPRQNMEEYGRDIAGRFNVASLMLMLDFSDEDKKPLAIKLAQIGIDQHATIKNGARWLMGGGIGAGRKWPTILTGILLNNTEMKYAYSPLGTDYYLDVANEDCQTFYNPGPGTYDYPAAFVVPAISEPVGTPVWGEWHCVLDEFPWGESDPGSISYRYCCTANAWHGSALSAIILDAKELWDHDVFFDYTDYYMDYMDSLDLSPGDDWLRTYTLFSPFMGNMWDTYRDRYGCIWKSTTGVGLGQYDCDGDGSYDVDCALISACGGYPTQRACEYDPCNASCRWNGQKCISSEGPECDTAADCSDMDCNTKDCVDGECVYTPVADGQHTSCPDNGDFCDGAEECQSGSCTSLGNPCTDDDIACTILCDEITDTCNVPDDSLCQPDESCVAEIGCVVIPCDNGTNRSCDTGELGICSAGTQICTGDVWGSCVRDVGPSPEICNDTVDNDCDGQTDCIDSLDCSEHPDCEITFPTDYVSFWKFEGNADDERGVNDGTLMGDAAIFSDPARGQVLSLDASGDYVEIPYDNSLDITQNLTVSAWVYAKSFATDGNYAWIIQVNEQDGYGFFASGTLAQLRAATGGSGYAPNSGDLDLNTWHHAVMVTSGLTASTINISIYLDGVYLASAPGNNMNANNEGLYIGRSDAAFRGHWNGTMDDVMLYNRSLTEEEIQQIYCSQSGTC